MPDLQVGKSVVHPRTFFTVENLFGMVILQFVGRLFGDCMVGLMATSSRRAYATGLLYPESLPLWQATVFPPLRRRLVDTHRQVWLSVSWGHCSFLLGPGAHKALSVPSKNLFPQSCGSSVIKFHWPPKSNSLGVLSPLARSPGWEIHCGS